MYVNFLRYIKCSRVKPEWAQDHGLEIDENKHRWIKPDTGEIHDHPENDKRWEEGLESILKRFSNSTYDINDIFEYADMADEFEKYVKYLPSYVNSRTSTAIQSYTDEPYWNINSNLIEGIETAESIEISTLMNEIETPYPVYRGMGMWLTELEACRRKCS